MIKMPKIFIGIITSVWFVQKTVCKCVCVGGDVALMNNNNNNNNNTQKSSVNRIWYNLISCVAVKFLPWLSV